MESPGIDAVESVLQLQDIRERRTQPSETRREGVAMAALMRSLDGGAGYDVGGDAGSHSTPAMDLSREI